MKFIALLFVFALFVTFSHSKKRYKTFTMSQSKYMNRFKWPIHVTHTPDNDWGNQATIYLDRHAPNCGIGAISQFHLQRARSGGSWNRIRYDTWCVMPMKCNKRCPTAIQNIDRQYCKWFTTQQEVLGSWTGMATNYLDRHYVRCPHGYVLNYFRFRSNWNNHRVWYKYKCCPAAVHSCRTYNTSMQAYGNMGNIYLDRQWVKTPNIQNQAIVGFKLFADYKDQGFYYKVDYCSVRG